jgi:hypothetical protein
VLAHLHGLRGRTAGFDLSMARGLGVRTDDPVAEPLFRAHLLSAVRTLGGSTGNAVEEMSVAAATLQAALLLAAARAAERGAARPDLGDFEAGLPDAADGLQGSGALGRVLGNLGRQPEALLLFAAGQPY